MNLAAKIERTSMNAGKPGLTLAFCVVAMNEETALPELFEALLAQTYPLSCIQVLLVDSESNDGTLGLMQRFKDEYESNFMAVSIFENPAKLQAPGWNIALRHANCDLIMRMDAHASIPRNYIESIVNWIIAGEDICGGKVISLPGNDSDMAFVVNMAETSMFGGSAAAFRRSDEPRYVDTVAFAAYRKEVFDAVGLFDERLARTEDNEIHYRMRKAGFRFFYDPRIVSTRRTRATFWLLAKQKFLNGYWIGRTLGVSSHCFSIYHYVPLCFVLAIMLTTTAIALGIYWPAILLWSTYFIAAVVMTIFAIASSQRKPAQSMLLPLMFLVLHIGYGIGTLLGIFTIPKMLVSNWQS